jgi:hypothetical protein
MVGSAFLTVVLPIALQFGNPITANAMSPIMMQAVTTPVVVNSSINYNQMSQEDYYQNAQEAYQK